MIRKELLIGISLAAFAAGTAAAQNQSRTDSNGNSSTASCSTAAGNVCTVVNQEEGNDNNSSLIRVNGSGNVVAIRQRGDDNRSEVEIDGDQNSVQHDQTGDDLFARTDIDGDNNDSEIFQGDDENRALVVQNGDDNSSTVVQGFLFVGGGFNFGDVGTGEENVASVNQTGTNLTSLISQGGNIGVFGGATADNNSATVTQSGTGSSSTVLQQSRGNSARVNIGGGGVDDDTETAGTPANTSFVQQTNTVLVSDGSGGFESGSPNSSNNPTSGNIADVAITSADPASVQGNSSTVVQNGVQNNARVSILNGGAGVVRTGQTGRGGEDLGAGRSQGNTSAMNQQGFNNRARIGSGGRVQNFGGSGNSSTINQGLASSSEEANFGRNHSATVFQTGTLDTVTINQDDNQGSNTVSSTGNQNGSVGDVAQRTLNSSVSLTQRGTNFARISQGGGDAGNNSVTVNQTDAGDMPGQTEGGDIFTDPTTSPATAAQNSVRISQAGVTNDIDVTQNAVNANATVFQMLNSRNNVANIEQGTNADRSFVTSGTAGGGGTGPGGAAVNAPTVGSEDTGANAVTLTANVTQSGRGADAIVRQDGDELNASITQSGNNTNATTGAATDSNNLAQISQVNNFNSAAITQNGFSNTATVDQRGTGTRANRNQITISQSGDRHSAIARQTETVGASASGSVASGPTGSPRAAGGVQSAEIIILQAGSIGGTATGNGTGNTAQVEQQGRGQFARIDQSGRNNNAGILQTNLATNSAAIITQTGNGNSFFITQNQPGQFFSVTQTGNNNQTSQTSSGPPNSAGGTPGGTGSSGTNPFAAPTTP